MTEHMPGRETTAEEWLDSLPYPAFLLDDRRFIVYRNKASRLRSFHIRIRARIDSYATKKASERIREMAVGEELFFDLTEENCYGAVIHRFETGYWVAIRTITAHMAKYVADLARRIPGFFGESMDAFHAASDRYASKEEITKARLRYNRIARYQNAMAAYFAVTAGELTQGNALELTSCIHPILDCAVKFLRPNGINLSVKQTVRSATAMGNAGAIRFAAAAMISVAAENTADGRIRAETRQLEGKFALHITFEPALPEDVTERLLECYYGGELLESAYRDICFDLLLLQMVSEKMGWKFGVTKSGCTDGLIALTLYIPTTEEASPGLNCPFYPMPLLEIAFARLLSPKEIEGTPLL